MRSSWPDRRSEISGAIAVLALAGLLLAGCAAGPGAAAGPTPTPGSGSASDADGGSSPAPCDPASSGADSDAVAEQIGGEFGAQASWDFAAAVHASSTQRTVAIAGDASRGIVTDGRTASITYTFFNGTTGSMLESWAQFSSDPMPLPYQSGTAMPGVEKTLDCAAVGARLVSVVTPDDAFGAAGLPDKGLGASDDIIMVIDVIAVVDTPKPSAPPAAAPPTPQPWDEAVPMPDVDMRTAVPTITIPDADPSPLLLEKVLRKGDGALVPAGAYVTVDYLGVRWDDGTAFDSSYARGEPAGFVTSGVIPGFAGAIVGQPIGSTVLVSIPPAYGYGPTPSADNPLGGATLVFLIQILDASDGVG